MLTRVRNTRRRAALLTATTLTLLIVSGTAVAAVDSAAAPGAGPAAQAWSLDLGARTADDAGVRLTDGALRLDAPAGTDPASTDPAGLDASGTPQTPAHQEASGQLVAEPVTLDEPAGTVTADVDATTPAGTSVLVDVRGRRADQGPDSWTEWVPAGSPLPAAARTVQARVTLVGEPDTSPAVRKVTLTPGAGTLTPEAGRSQSLQELQELQELQDESGEAGTTANERTYSVFATREGLVGGTTANGHVITSRDHFVALPSRRGLAPNDSSGSYSVRVCAASTGRCAYAPVWDVGPWNTTDDHWNAAATRQSWTDLPQGRPQAQAAYQDGYNDGLDGFGRRVANPAGIDLADGTFWDAVGLTDNAWTTVTYLWTGSGPKGIVRTNGGPLTVRSGPGTNNTAVGQAGNYANVVIECTATGTTVTGTYGTTNVWNRIGPGNWVSDAYVNTGSDTPVAPVC